MENPYHLTVLSECFERKKKKNPRYSLRAYASYLGVHPSALSRVMKGKQPLSSKSGISIVRKLALGSEERRLFLQSVTRSAYEADCRRIATVLGSQGLAANPKVIPEDVYEVIACLDCLALAQLTYTRSFRPEVAFIARRLGLDEATARRALEAMLRSGLLVAQEGTYAVTDARLTAADVSTTNRARRKLQAEILQKASESLERDPITKRAHYGMTMAIDPSRVEQARARISEFVEELCDQLGTGTATEVYQLGVQFFPLSHESKATL